MIVSSLTEHYRNAKSRKVTVPEEALSKDDSVLIQQEGEVMSYNPYKQNRASWERHHELNAPIGSRAALNARDKRRYWER